MDPAELTTAFTDVILAGASAFLAHRLHARAPQPRGIPFVVVFAASAVAALAGAAYHGFRHAAPQPVLWSLWRLVQLGIVTSSLGLLLGVANLRCSGWGRRALGALAWGKGVAAGIYGLSHDELTVLGLDLAVTLFLLALIEIRSLRRCAAGAWWLLAGTAVTLVAAAIQVTGWRHGTPWNHNDVFHLLQIPALWCFDLGARAALRADPHTTDPAATPL